MGPLKRRIVIGALALSMLWGAAQAAAQGSPDAANSGAAGPPRASKAALAAPAAFVDVRRFAAISGDADAGKQKSAVCASCHGADGRSLGPAFPSLAGQSATYTYLQLESYKESWRKNPIMEPLAAQLMDEDMRDLAAYYAGLPVQPATTTSAAAAADTLRGRQLYLNGDPQKGVPPCQGCHGESGEGPPPSPDAARRNLSTYPALVGLSAEYVKAQLMAYADGSRSATTNALLMAGPARSLDEESMSAIAAYLERLPASAAK